jgi:hypothetical protein
MKSFSGLFATILVAVSLSSCYTMISITKTVEPEIVPEKKYNRIAFINRFDYTLPEHVMEKHEGVYHAGVKKFIEGLATFSDNLAFRFVVADTLEKGIGGALTAFLPIDTINAICTRHNADLLLSLDTMHIYIDWETIADEDASAGSLKTHEYYLNSIFYTSLYSLNGKLVNRSETGERIQYKSRPALIGAIAIEPSIAKAGIASEKNAFAAGKDYVAKFHPQSRQEIKKIYVGKVFKESNSCMYNNDWFKAGELLHELSNSPDPKIAKKARQNLDVVIETLETKGYYASGKKKK